MIEPNFNSEPMHIIVAFSIHKYQFYSRCLEIKHTLLIGLDINMNSIVLFYTVYALEICNSSMPFS